MYNTGAKHMRAPVTMPETETIAGRVSGPVLLSFLKSRIGKLTKYNLKWTFSSIKHLRSVYG